MNYIFIEWNDGFSVDNAEIDNQHKKLIRIINDLYESRLYQNEYADLEHILDNLYDYIDYHFETEEHYMAKCRFEGIDAHIKEHKDFLKKIITFRNEFESGNYNISEDVYQFLKEWLVNHILYSDRQYMKALKEHGY